MILSGLTLLHKWSDLLLVHDFTPLSFIQDFTHVFAQGIKISLFSESHRQDCIDSSFKEILLSVLAKMFRKGANDEPVTHPATDPKTDVFLVRPGDSLLTRKDKVLLDNVTTIIEREMSNPDFGVKELSEQLGMSIPVLYKKLRNATGMSINDFSKSLRLKRAAMLLEDLDLSVAEIAKAVGFLDRRYFSREFKKAFGINPSDFKKRSNELNQSKS